MRLAPTLLLLCALPAVAQPTYGHKDPYEVLRIAADSSAALASARFDALIERKYFHGTQTESSGGRIVAARDTTNDVGVRYRLDGANGDLIVYTGEQAWVGFGAGSIEHFDDPESAAGSALSQPVTGLITRLLFDGATTYPGVVDAALEIECEGLDTVGGVVCHALTVRMPDADGYTGRVRRYSFGADDFVLRRLVSETQWEGLTERLVFTVSALEANPTIAASEIAYVAGKGSREVRRVTKAELEAPRPEVLVAGAAAPEFTLKEPSGESVSLAALRGKVVVLDFWGTWCRPCVDALPEMQKIHEEYRERGVVVVGVNIEYRAGADPAAMMKRKGATYQLALDGAPVVRAYGITTFPSMVVVDREGRVVTTLRGSQSGPELRRVLDGML